MGEVPCTAMVLWEMPVKIAQDALKRPWEDENDKEILSREDKGKKVMHFEGKRPKMEALRTNKECGTATVKQELVEEDNDVWIRLDDSHVTATWVDSKGEASCLWQPKESEKRAAAKSISGGSSASSALSEESEKKSAGSSMPGPSTSNARKLVKQALDRFEKLRQKHGGMWHNVGKEMRIQGQWVNRGVRYIGHVPGIEIGDTFDYRIELCIVGLHTPLQGGIGWIKGSDNKWGEPVACSIVLSGVYDDKDEGDTFEYVGSGGHNSKNQLKGTKDQDLKGANLALANSCRFLVPVRVIRGTFYDGKKSYRYDGLYSVVRFWNERSSTGSQVYKYLVKRSEIRAGKA